MRDKFSNKSELWRLLDDEEDPSAVRAYAPGRSFQRPDQIREMLAEELEQPEARYNFTYQAGRHERLWLGERLQEFYNDNLISDVLSMVKGGKEANVYCCQAHPNLGMDLVAVKVYRPRLLRNLKNDALYKQGRELLGNDGKVMHDQRARRAVLRGSRIGKEMSIVSWIAHEYQALEQLKQAGADVPAPISQSETSLLMEFIGEEGLPAPVLHAVTLDRQEAASLFERLVWNLELMLAQDRVHADLSAFNVLYWDGEVRIIDFPQVVSPLENHQARDLLLRDVERLCQYFEQQGLRLNHTQIASDLWGRYKRGEIGGHGREVEDPV